MTFKYVKLYFKNILIIGNLNVGNPDKHNNIIYLRIINIAFLKTNFINNIFSVL